MTKTQTWFDSKHQTPKQRLLFEQERAVIMAAEEVSQAMKAANISKAELARRLGTSKAYVTQALAGGQNMTLRSLASFAWACGNTVDVRLQPASSLSLIASRFLWCVPSTRELPSTMGDVAEFEAMLMAA
jgi:hypothetical protein